MIEWLRSVLIQRRPVERSVTAFDRYIDPAIMAGSSDMHIAAARRRDQAIEQFGSP